MDNDATCASACMEAGSRARFRPWTPEEDSAVRERFFSAGTAGLARELGRTETAVRIRAGRLGLRTRQRRLWSRDEVCRLCDLIRNGKTMAEAARVLCRPVASVHLKLRMLGLGGPRSARPWTPSQMAVLRGFFGQGLPLKEIGERLGRSPNACRQMAYRLGLLRRQGEPCPSAAMEDVPGASNE